MDAVEAGDVDEELEALEALYPGGLLKVTRRRNTRGLSRDDDDDDDDDARRHPGVAFKAQPLSDCRADCGSSGGSGVAPRWVVELALDVTPRTLDDVTQQYVRTTLHVALDDRYPGEYPSVRLADARGLDERRQAEVLDRLRRAAQEHAAPGDPILALLCETAFETLTELNHPDGDCPFCLTPVAGDEATPFMKLMSCYHCFHVSCFGDWWRWKAEAAANAALERGRHPLGSEEAAAEPVHLCPCCRVPIEEGDVSHVSATWDDGGGIAAAGAGREGAHGRDGTGEEGKKGETLTAAEMKAIRAQRQRFEKALRRQQARGGIIGEGDGEGIALVPGAVAADYAPMPPPPPWSPKDRSEQRERSARGGRRGNRGGRGGDGGSGGGRGGGGRGGRGGRGDAPQGSLGWLKKAATGPRSGPMAGGDSAGARVDVGVDVSRGRGQDVKTKEDGLGWLANAAASSAASGLPAPVTSASAIERGVREMNVNGEDGQARPGGQGRGGRGRGGRGGGKTGARGGGRGRGRGSVPPSPDQ